jgi:hypothetical protein
MMAFSRFENLPRLIEGFSEKVFCRQGVKPGGSQDHKKSLDKAVNLCSIDSTESIEGEEWRSESSL